MVMQKVKDGAAVEDASTGDSVDQLKSARDVKFGEQKRISQELQANPDRPNWEQWASDAYRDSTDFLDSSVRVNWERSDRSFQNRHPSGSKYFSDAYKHRSKIYRPKTRSMVRQFEAQTAQAYFSTEEVANVVPMDDSDPQQLASAALMSELLKYRLSTKNSNVAIPWFQTVMGAAQDATKYGIVVSKQWWNYRERVYDITMRDPTGEPILDDDGNPFTSEERRVIMDRPEIQLYPPENVRIDRGSDWIDPVNSSPFLILQHPMYIDEIEARMLDNDPKTNSPRWHNVGRSQLKSVGQKEVWDSTRTHREANRDDSKESEISIEEYSIIWVHENFMRWRDADFVYFTAGSEILLSDPKPVTEVYRHCRENERPVVMGYTVFEAHKLYPDSKIRLTEGLQVEANEIVNQRLDNVKLAMNKRYLVQRGRQVDLVSLTRSAPGTITMVNDIDKDVKEIDTKDVTSSSYAEQDRINADFDDIAGAVNTGSVQTNRKLNETVGGMQMMASSANQISELDLRWLNESWAEKVLLQLVHMEQVYENDPVVLALAGKRAKLIQRFKVDSITDELMAHDLTVMVNAGLGAQPPDQRLKNFVTGAQAVKELIGDALDPMMLNVEEIVKEIFAPLGYRDGKRFFHFGDDDPRIQMLQQQVEQLQEVLDKRILDNETKRQVAQISASARVMQQQVENQGKMEEAKLGFIHDMQGKINESERSFAEMREKNMASFRETAMQLASAERVARERPNPVS